MLNMSEFCYLLSFVFQKVGHAMHGWLRGTVVERWSLTGELATSVWRGAIW